MAAGSNDGSERRGGEGRPPIPDEDLLDELERLADELGHSPSAREMKNEGAYRPDTYADHFGSWNAAKERIGLDITPYQAPHILPRRGVQEDTDNASEGGEA